MKSTKRLGFYFEKDLLMLTIRHFLEHNDRGKGHMAFHCKMEIEGDEQKAPESKSDLN